MYIDLDCFIKMFSFQLWLLEIERTLPHKKIKYYAFPFFLEDLGMTSCVCTPPHLSSRGLISPFPPASQWKVGVGEAYYPPPHLKVWSKYASNLQLIIFNTINITKYNTLHNIILYNISVVQTHRYIIFTFLYSQA